MRSAVERNLSLEFTEPHLTSYAGLELLRRHVCAHQLGRLVRGHLGPALSRDVGRSGFLRLILALVLVGRRLRHIEFLRSAPMRFRFARLKRLPTIRTTSRWLQRFRGRTIEQSREITATVVASSIAAYLSWRAPIIDVEGAAVSTGMMAERAFRGHSLHHRNVPSYYPITAHLAETVHVLRAQNRTGNFSDGEESLGFRRDPLRQLDPTLGAGYRSRFRMDADFFKSSLSSVLDGGRAR